MRTRYVPRLSRLFQDAHLPQILLNGSRLGMVAAVSGPYLFLMLLSQGSMNRFVRLRIDLLGSAQRNKIQSLLSSLVRPVVS
jgi:hypothetical protein